MAAKKTPWLTYGLIAGGGILAWYWWQSSQPAAAAPATVPVTPALPAPAGQTLPSGQVLSPVPGQQLPVATTMPALPNGIPQNVYSVVQSWAQTDGRAPVLMMAAADVASEYAGMYDLITNYWDKNIAPGPAQVSFWNALRAKYDPGPPADQVW